MTPTTRTRLLSRTALALGWLVLALVATTALADPPVAKCDKKLNVGERCPGWKAAIPPPCTARGENACEVLAQVNVSYNDFSCETLVIPSQEKACVMAYIPFGDNEWIPIMINCYTTYNCDWNPALEPIRCNIDPDSRLDFDWELHEEVACPTLLPAD